MNSHKNARLTPHGRALLVSRILDHGLCVFRTLATIQSDTA